mmetsp:Transcript_19840/g.58563  ORF Transcript_19840/g.58563 Transcript_19840/m.58563 type:complete len:285 (+) Transcript_19840:614-1468(+)
MPAQKRRNAHCVVRLPLHAQRHGLQAAQAEPALKGAECRSLCILNECHLVHEFRALHGQNAARGVGVPRNELCRGRHGDVRAERNRLLEDRRHDAVVHCTHGPNLVCGSRNACNVRNLQAWVCGALQENKVCLRPGEGIPDFCQVTHVDVIHLDPQVGSDAPEQAACAPVNVVSSKNPTPIGYKSHDRRNRRHSRCEREAAIGAVKGSHLLLKHGSRGISGARVVILSETRRSRLVEGGGLKDRSRHRTILVHLCRFGVAEAGRHRPRRHRPPHGVRSGRGRDE